MSLGDHWNCVCKLTRRPVPAGFLMALLVQVPMAGLRAQVQPYSRPSLNPSGIESAFIANQGDYYGYAVGYGYELNGLSGTDLVVDGGLGLGFGLGSSRDALAVQIGYNLNGIKGEDLGGTVDLKVARDLVVSKHLRLGLGAGVLGALSHGTEPNSGNTPFVVSTLALPVRFDDKDRTLQFNAGYGGGRFREERSPDLLEQGVFASAGLEVADNVGISIGWSGRGLNATVSVIPVRGVPLGISVSATNITDHDDLGPAAALSIGWGGSFQTASF
ncbi:hypothetical protein ICNINCKA_01766 [Synechococcus sp. CBW1107]|nr:hypothetical protein ICNINCKA_01766 [Synechococcus sp. CBW1107]